MYNIYLLYTVFHNKGVAKTKIITWKCSKPYSWFIHRPSSKFYFVDIFENPTKSSKNPNFPIPNHLSYPISSKPTKIKHFSHFTTQKSNSHFIKNPSTIPKLSLFISTFTDNDFSSKNSKSYNPTHRGGYHKTTHKTIKTVIALSYFYAKNKIKQRIYNQEFINCI